MLLAKSVWHRLVLMPRRNGDYREKLDRRIERLNKHHWVLITPVFNTRSDDEFVDDSGPALDLEWDDSLSKFVVVDEDGEVIGTAELP